MRYMGACPGHYGTHNQLQTIAVEILQLQLTNQVCILTKINQYYSKCVRDMHAHVKCAWTIQNERIRLCTCVYTIIIIANH